MLKGVFFALGIMIVSAIIPLVHFVAFPASQFIGGYLGINFASSDNSSYGVKALKFGALLALLFLVVAALVAIVLNLVVDLNSKVRLVMWLGVGVFTLYTASMSAMGAMYAELKRSGT